MFNKKIGETKLDGITDASLQQLVTDLNAATGEDTVTFTMDNFGDSVKNHDDRLKILKEKFGITDDIPATSSNEVPKHGKWREGVDTNGKVDPKEIDVIIGDGDFKGGKRRSRKRRSSKKKRKNKKSKKSRKAKKSRKSRK